MTSKAPLFVETLEPRIAPAILVNGGNLLGGNGNPTTGESSSGGNTVTLVKVLSGTALVFYDANLNHISSISVGPNTKLDITGSVDAIVTNLDANGRLTDSDGDPSNGEDGGILLPSNIKGISTHPLVGNDYGSIGEIIAGGKVKNVSTESANATVHGIYAGDGVFRNTSVVQVSTGDVDYNSIETGAQTNFFLSASASEARPGASIANATISIGAGLQVYAGSGANDASGPGGAGGSISGITVTQSYASGNSAAAIDLHAGDGGSGTTGGAGGSISAFTDAGSTDLVKIQTGHGGVGSDGDGGAGGSFLSSTITTKSPQYQLNIADGGDGSVHGGVGGKIKGLTFTANIESAPQVGSGGAVTSGTLIASGDFNNDGQSDVVVINASSGDATVSLADSSNSSGYSQVTQANGTAFISPQGLTPSDIVTGDFNGDGLLDFAVSYAGSNNLGIFLNQGGGHFISSQVTLASTPYRLAVGDFTGNPALDLAYLSLPVTSTDGTITSRVYVAENDGAGNFTPHIAYTSVTGTASDIVAAPIDGDPHTDLFLSLNDDPGTVLALASAPTSGAAPFNVISNIQTEVGHLTNIDAKVVNSTVELLAFSTDVTGAGGATAMPDLHLLAINSSGQETSNVAGAVVSGATLARFVGSAGDYGVLTGASVLITSLDGTSSKSYSTADGALTNFASLSTDPSDPVAAVGAIPTRFFLSDGSSFDSVALPVLPQIFSFASGSGGHGGSGNGGFGGGIKGLTFTETLDGGADAAGGSYTVAITTGAGGVSDLATGGAGGSMKTVSVNVDPADSLAGSDDTTLLYAHTGAGGNGANGGAGGSLSGLTATALFDEVSDDGVRLNSFAADLGAGAGGVGASGFGGAGGSVTLAGKAALTGVTFYDFDSGKTLDPALTVTAGAGGNGATYGGAGGSLINVGSQNALLDGGAVLATNELTGAALVSGKGGDGANGAGGAGGDIMSADISVQADALQLSDGTYLTRGGSLSALAGAGGAAVGGVGGNGGAIKSSTLASVQGDSHLGFGVLAHGGTGGAGSNGGGKGGNVTKLTIDSPSDPSIYAAAVFGGDGGAAMGGGIGGNGGFIKGVTQTKDVNSSINVMIGGAGGAGGGIGGSIKKVNSVGFIGSPNSDEAGDQANLGVFNNTVNSPTIEAYFPAGLVPQGLFAGRGDGGNGSVQDIVARQIAAIGATPDAQGLFAPASFVNNVQADLIGFEVNRDNVFQSGDGTGASPQNDEPVDGFILAQAIGQVTTINPGRTSTFTFIG